MIIPATPSNPSPFPAWNAPVSCWWFRMIAVENLKQKAWNDWGAALWGVMLQHEEANAPQTNHQLCRCFAPYGCSPGIYLSSHQIHANPRSKLDPCSSPLQDYNLQFHSIPIIYYQMHINALFQLKISWRSYRLHGSRKRALRPRFGRRKCSWIVSWSHDARDEMAFPSHSKGYDHIIATCFILIIHQYSSTFINIHQHSSMRSSLH